MADHPTAPCDSLWLYTDACFLKYCHKFCTPVISFQRISLFEIFQSECSQLRMSGSATKLKKRRRPSVSPLTTKAEIEAHKSLERWTCNKLAYIFYAYRLHCLVFPCISNEEFSGESKKQIPGRRKCLWLYRRMGRSLCLRRSFTRRRLPSTLRRGRSMAESLQLSHLSWWQNPDQSMYVAIEHINSFIGYKKVQYWRMKETKWFLTHLDPGHLYDKP